MRRAGRLVGDINGVVLAVRAGDPEPHRRPAPEAEAALLRDRAGEDERPPVDLVIDATSLENAVHVDLERGRHVLGQLDARRLAHPHRMPEGCAGSFFPSSASPVVAALAGAGAAAAANGGFSPAGPALAERTRDHGDRVLGDLRLHGGRSSSSSSRCSSPSSGSTAAAAAGRTVDGAQVHGHTRLELIWTAGAGAHPHRHRRARLLRATGDQERAGGGEPAAGHDRGRTSTTGSSTTRTARARSTTCTSPRTRWWTRRRLVRRDPQLVDPGSSAARSRRSPGAEHDGFEADSPGTYLGQCAELRSLTTPR